MKKWLKVSAVCGISALYLCGCGDKTVSGDTVTIATISGPSASNAGTIQMGAGFTFTATVASGNLSNQALVVTTAGPVASVTTTPTGCTLGATGSSCSYTVTTNWDNTKTNGYTATYDITLSASNATLSTNTISYTYAAPSIYLPQTGDAAPATNQAGIPYPSPRFTADTPSCKVDQLTGLGWVTNPTTTTYTQTDATTYITTLNAGTCGHTDWRLPTVNELASLVNYSDSTSPAHYLNNNGFQNVQTANYWSSTAVSSLAGTAWLVRMDYGLVNYGNTSGNGLVWAVRGGQ